MTVYDYEPGQGGPEFAVCPDTGCWNTEDLMVQECASGLSWVFTSSVCSHWGFIFKKPAYRGAVSHFEGRRPGT